MGVGKHKRLFSVNDDAGADAFRLVFAFGQAEEVIERSGRPALMQGCGDVDHGGSHGADGPDGGGHALFSGGGGGSGRDRCGEIAADQAQAEECGGKDMKGSMKREHGASFGAFGH